MTFNSERVNHQNSSLIAMENSLSKENLKSGLIFFHRSLALVLLVDSWESQLYRFWLQ